MGKFVVAVLAALLLTWLPISWWGHRKPERPERSTVAVAPHPGERESLKPSSVVDVPRQDEFDRSHRSESTFPLSPPFPDRTNERKARAKSAPFVVSASHDATCAVLKAKGSGRACEAQRLHLAEMEAEDRDPEWAGKMEQTLQSLVESDRSAFYSVRNLECATTWCAMEVVSPANIYYVPLSYIEESRIRLITRDIVVGLETGPAGNSEFVTLVLFKRS